MWKVILGSTGGIIALAIILLFSVSKHQGELKTLDEVQLSMHNLESIEENAYGRLSPRTIYQLKEMYPTRYDEHKPVWRASKTHLGAFFVDMNNIPVIMYLKVNTKGSVIQIETGEEVYGK